MRRASNGSFCKCVLTGDRKVVNINVEIKPQSLITIVSFNRCDLAVELDSKRLKVWLMGKLSNTVLEDYACSQSAVTHRQKETSWS